MTNHIIRTLYTRVPYAFGRARRDVFFAGDNDDGNYR
jgi:hypothetical protein